MILPDLCNIDIANRVKFGYFCLIRALVPRIALQELLGILLHLLGEAEGIEYSKLGTESTELLNEVERRGDEILEDNRVGVDSKSLRLVLREFALRGMQGQRSQEQCGAG